MIGTIYYIVGTISLLIGLTIVAYKINNLYCSWKENSNEKYKRVSEELKASEYKVLKNIRLKYKRFLMFLKWAWSRK